jgi:hypothetical protein
VTVRYPASRGYAAYRLAGDPGAGEMTATVTSGADSVHGHFLLPPGPGTAKSVEVDGAAVPFWLVRVGESGYVDFELDGGGVRTVRIRY